jgi:hypothetical protein
MLPSRITLAIALCLASAVAASAGHRATPASRKPTTHSTTRPAVSLKYQKATPEQNAAAMADARRNATEIQKSLEVEFTELQTPHFLIFTDWPASEQEFLKSNLEAAYAVVSRAFDIPVHENVFIGKLPIYMFDKPDDFKKFAKEFDEVYLPDGVAGYFAGHSDGAGHMAMWKPNYTGGAARSRDAVNQWAYTLTHEFTHAFVARYRTNKNIPTWLNEGIAETIASGQFPRPNTRAYAKRLARYTDSLEDIFSENGFKGPDAYPIMQTLVQTLIAQNRASFLPMFNSIKDGADPEAALKEFYNLDYASLESAWRRDLQRR